MVHRDVAAPAGPARSCASSDTTQALEDLGRHVRAEGGACPVVAITGSAGKTTTKEMTAALLAHARARCSRRRGTSTTSTACP